MKLSRYVHFSNNPGTGKVYLFSARTCGLAELDPETEKHLTTGQLEKLPLEYQEELQRGRVLVPSGQDERGALLMSMIDAMASKRHLGLTIVPTTACNFDCDYCFEAKDQLTFMSERVQDLVIDFIRFKGPEVLSVTWYGGEPLLGMNQLRRLSRATMELAGENHVKYSSNIVTNGYLLDGDVAEELKGYGVHHAQITLDGSKTTHNKRRPLKGGGPTFSRILSNIAAASKHLDIAIRVNVDKRNQHEAIEVVNTLKSLGVYPDKVSCYISPVSPSDAGVRSPCHTNTEFADFAMTMLQDACIQGTDCYCLDQFTCDHVCYGEGCNYPEYAPPPCGTDFGPE